MLCELLIVHIKKLFKNIFVSKASSQLRRTEELPLLCKKRDSCFSFLLYYKAKVRVVLLG